MSEYLMNKDCEQQAIKKDKKSHHRFQHGEQNMQNALKYKALFENANDAIFTLKNDRFVECNPMTLTLFDCTQEDIINSTPYELSPPNQPDGKDSKTKAEEMITLALGGRPQFFPWRHLRKNGQIFDAEVSLNRIEMSGGVFLQCIIRDITERKQAESLMQEREQLYRSLFEKNCLVILLIEEDSAVIIDANPSACTFYGYSKEKLIGMKLSDINMLSQTDMRNEMKQAKLERQNYFISRHRLANGDIRDVEVFCGPIFVSGKNLFCSIVHDITSRKIHEQEREQLIRQLQKAMSEVKTLRGFIPICSACKNIRDDKGYWNQIEEYIRAHSDAQFSHGICPTCAKKLYPDLVLGD